MFVVALYELFGVCCLKDTAHSVSYGSNTAVITITINILLFECSVYGKVEHSFLAM